MIPLPCYYWSEAFCSTQCLLLCLRSVERLSYATALLPLCCFFPEDLPQFTVGASAQFCVHLSSSHCCVYGARGWASWSAHTDQQGPAMDLAQSRGESIISRIQLKFNFKKYWCVSFWSTLKWPYHRCCCDIFCVSSPRRKTWCYMFLIVVISLYVWGVVTMGIPERQTSTGNEKQPPEKWCLLLYPHFW